MVEYANPPQWHNEPSQIMFCIANPELTRLIQPNSNLYYRIRFVPKQYLH
jgi:hypothetical protein